MRERAAIVGCGAITAMGRGVETLRRGMRQNASGLRACGRFNHPRFQSNIVGAVDPNEFESEDDPAYRLATLALEEMRAAARTTLAGIAEERISLVLSTTKANIDALERISEGRPCSSAAKRHLQADLLALDLAAEHHAFGLRQTISLACVSGLIALQQGARLIERGDADAVFVVGVDHLSAFVMAGFSALKALDPVGCQPFDRDRCGLSPGEAGGAVALVRADLASSDSITFVGWGSSNDANHMTGPSRDGSGLALAIQAALRAANLRPQEVDYVNVHGTGTRYNDAMESAALRTVFGETCPPVSGFKGMLGHTLGAAGVVETIACVLAMQESLLPGTSRLNTASAEAPASIVKQSRAVAKLDRVLKLNTGFGGANGALVLAHG